MISGGASRSTLNVNSQCNYQRSISGVSDADIPFLGSSERRNDSSKLRITR